MKIMYILAGLMLMASSVFAFGACDNAGSNLQEAAQCIIWSGFGGVSDLLSIIIIGAVILLAFAARIPGPLALMLGMGLTVGLDLAFGRSTILEGLIFLQLLGFGVMIFTSFFNLGKLME